MANLDKLKKMVEILAANKIESSKTVGLGTGNISLTWQIGLENAFKPKN